MAKASWLFLCILSASSFCDGYKILVIFPVPGKSHSILGDGVVRHLLNAGHEVTRITAYKEKGSHPNLRQIDVRINDDLIFEKAVNVKAIMDQEFDLTDHRMMMFLMHLTAIKAIEHENFQNLLHDPKEHFDLIIAEWMFSHIYSGIAAVYDAPFIWFSSIEPHWMALSIIDEGGNPAYNADCVSSNIAPFTFKQRLQELWVQIKVTFYQNFIFNGIERQDYERLLAPIIVTKGRQPPAYDELKYNASLMLGNSHVSLGEATRLPQNYKPVGGYHMDETIEPLPEDLKKIMDNAKNGVIYFSMGSNLKSKDLPDELKTGILKLFGELKQIVLWKFEEVLSNLPKNVHFLKWAPQQSILSHPNCVLFITHGGLLSTTETIHFGVPIIGIPVFADQFLNVERAVNKGFAKRVTLSYTIADDLKDAINDVLNNPKYAKKVKELSLIYHDRVASPGAELVHWVEHVGRTRGAPHLRSPALFVPWYQKMYLDLAALIIVTLIIIKILIKRVFSMIFNGEIKTKKKIN